MAIATSFYGSIGFIGLQYITGECKELVDGTLAREKTVVYAYNDFIFANEMVGLRRRRAAAEDMTIYEDELQELLCGASEKCKIENVQRNTIAQYGAGVTYTYKNEIQYDAADDAVQECFTI